MAQSCVKEEKNQTPGPIKVDEALKAVLRAIDYLPSEEVKLTDAVIPDGAAFDAVDGSSRRHLGAKMIVVEVTIERGADHE